MIQLELFKTLINGEPVEFRQDVEPRTLARRTDRETSHEAAREHVASGANKRHKDAILAILKRQGTATASELSEVTGRYSSRVSELRRDGYDIRAKRVDKIWEFTLIEQ